jgi:hypothetical protein
VRKRKTDEVGVNNELVDQVAGRSRQDQDVEAEMEVVPEVF